MNKLNFYRKTKRIISDRVKDGDALKFDLLSTQVKHNNAENELIDLQNHVKKDYEFLDMFTGQQGDGYITREGYKPLNTEGHEEVTSDKSYDLDYYERPVEGNRK